MALALNDRVQQSGTANTTVSFTLTGSVTGFQSFAVVGNGNTTYYSAFDGSGNWEVGLGTYSTTGPTLTRTTILSSSNSNTAVTFSGTVSIFVTYPSSKSVNLNAAGVAEIGSPISYADTGLVATFASTEAGYNQVVVQNKSTATNASANLNVSNDASTASTGFAELGINSSTFSNGAGCFNIPGASYVASAGTDLSIGTYGAYDIHFATNSNTTDSMTIHDNGGVSLGGYGNPGIGNLAVNKIVSGVSTITASAGTTILDAASTYYQVVVGTTTQTIRLPDATTLLNGTTFIVDNDSTGVVTVTDNASTSLDVIPPGGIGYLYLTNNSTIAGSWTAHGFLPSIYNFNNSTADFGNATITNAVWNGTTLSPAYGGTGLTTFSAANYALYSTSASTLAAGTLPVAAGGTGVTTSTGSGSVVLSTSPSLVTPLLGTPTSGDFSTGTFTWPTFNQNTTGTAANVTGTVGVLNGGTGLTSLTANYIPYGNGTSAYQSNASFTFNGTTFSAPSASLSENLGFTGTGNRITGDFSNATIANRVAFQTSTTNGNTLVGFLPNGTGVGAFVSLFGSNDPDNAARASIGINSTAVAFQSLIAGTGTYLPMSFSTGGSERLRITVNGGVSFGATGTAYGTAGQVLQSNGDAPPTWITSAGMTYPSGSGIAVVSGGTSWGTTLAAPIGTIVGTTDTQTLSNKTISADVNFITNLAASSFVVTGATGTIDGGAAQKAIPTGVVVGTTDTQTLTNKTLTEPTIIGTIIEDVYSVTTASATLTIDPANGSIQTITLGLSATSVVVSSFINGEGVTLMISDSTAFTIAWGASVVWVSGTAPTLTTTGYTVLELWEANSVVYGAFVGYVA